MAGIEEVLETTLESLDGVPEALHPLFAKDEESGHYRLAGVTAKGKLDEFRTNNRELHTKVTKLEERLRGFEGVDPEKARKLEEELRELRDQAAANATGKSAEELEKLLGERTERMRGDHAEQLRVRESKLEELKAERDALNQALAARVIDSEVAIAAAADGFVPEAVEDALALARRLFKVEEGKAVARKEDGTLMFSTDGESALTIKEWLLSTRKTKPHWWRSNASGGGKTADDEPAGGKTMTRAEHDRLAKTDPIKLHKRMRDGWKVAA